MKNSHFQFEKGLSLSVFRQCYATEDLCRDALFKMRWPNGYHCPKCGYKEYLQMKDGKTYQCRRCEHKTPVYVRTLLFDDKLPLKSLFLTRYLFTRLKKMLSTPVTRPFYRALLAVKRNIKRASRDMVHALISDEYCGIYIPWTARVHGWNNVEKVHWCYTQTELHNGKLYAIISAFAWPLKAVFFAVRRTMQCGPRVKKETGIPETRQFSNQLYLAIRYFIPPRAFYFYRLYDPTNYKLASQYIHHHETRALMWFIVSSKDRMILDDKRRFSQKCEMAGLPAVPIIAEFEGGRIERWANGNNKQLPKTDLFAKPAGGIQGLGAKLYTYQGGRYRKDDDGILVTHDELLDHLSECSRVEAYILQKRLFNHRDISGLSTGALCTVRVVTCRLPRNPARPLISVFKMPTGVHPTDNFRSGGLASPVEESSGILGRAVSKSLDGNRFTRHPDTGHKIVGVKIPFWPQIIELALQAHETFSIFSSVGWDIAVTEDGPLLIEGNPIWGIESLQRAHDRPLGTSCFPETFLLDFSRHKHVTPALRSLLLPKP